MRRFRRGRIKASDRATTWAAKDGDLARGLSKVDWGMVRQVTGANAWGEQILYRLKMHSSSGWDSTRAIAGCPIEECLLTNIGPGHTLWACKEARSLWQYCSHPGEHWDWKKPPPTPFMYSHCQSLQYLMDSGNSRTWSMPPNPRRTEILFEVNFINLFIGAGLWASSPHYKIFGGDDACIERAWRTRRFRRQLRSYTAAFGLLTWSSEPWLCLHSLSRELRQQSYVYSRSTALPRQRRSYLGQHAQIHISYYSSMEGPGAILDLAELEQRLLGWAPESHQPQSSGWPVSLTAPKSRTTQRNTMDSCLGCATRLANVCME
ncbi:unnamed protein product [Phytophthora fragariaefolia]|uniref:Unnamed protein product n=1 Tax=Phytophthora fragariaefolia TaxID=1490495 RepID=A0A9W7D7P9_9STRA|nr:unnamed protein product [Phytophthora fragariaefolia]